MGMTRKQMEETIEQGGSVLHNGRLHTSVQTLPSKAELASSDEDKAIAAEDLDAQIAKLQAQRDALGGNDRGKPDANTKTATDKTDGDKNKTK